MSKDSRFEGVLWNCPQNLSEEEKAQARANIGVGTGGGDVVVMHLENALGSFMEGDPIPAQDNPEIWEDMIDVILDGKILTATMGIEEGIGSNAVCRTFFQLPPEYPKEAVKELLRSNEELGTLDFMFDVSMYGGLINIGAKIKVSPTKGIIPYYFYMSSGSGGLSLEIGTIDYQTQTRAIVGEVFGFAYNENDDTYSISYSYLPHILADLQNQGKTITITGVNKNGSYMFASAPVKITITTAEPRSDFIAEVNTLGQYIVPNVHEGEQHPVLWRGGFKYIEAPSGGQVDGYYKLDSDQTFVIDFMLLDNPSDEESNGSLDD